MTEKKEEFTPGPWEVKNDVFLMKGDQFLAQFFPCQTVKELIANGNLAKAAPELLESLDEALELIQNLCFGGCATVSDEECEKASAMLKKGYAALDKARMKNSTPSTTSIPSIPTSK